MMAALMLIGQLFIKWLVVVFEYVEDSMKKVE